jgi:hypothetical protein
MHPTLQAEDVGYFPFALNFSLQLYVLGGNHWQSKLVMGTGAGVGIVLHHVPIADVQDFSKTAKTSRQVKQYSQNTAYRGRPNCSLTGNVAVTARTIES